MNEVIALGAGVHQLTLGAITLIALLLILAVVILTAGIIERKETHHGRT